MRTTLFTFVVLTFVSVKAIAQSTIYNLTDIDSLSNYISTDVEIKTFIDGHSVSVTSSTINNENHLFIVRKDQYGAELNESKFKLTYPTSYGKFIGIIGQNDKSIIAAIHDEFSVDIVKFDANNTIIWKEKISLPNVTYKYYQHKIINGENDNFYLMISDMEFLGVVKLSSTGAVLWSKQIVSGNSGGKSPGFSITKNNNGGVTCTLKDNSYECLVNLNGDGSLNWSKSFIDGSYRWPTSIKQTTDGSTYVAGIKNGVPYLHKFDNTGNIIYAKEISNFSEVFDFYIDENNFIYLLVSNTIGSTTLLKLNMNGEYVWNKSFGTMSNYYNNFIPAFINDENPTPSIKSAYQGNPVLVQFEADPLNYCNTYTNAAAQISNDEIMFSSELIINTNDVAISNLTTIIEPLQVQTTNEYVVNEIDFCSYILSNSEILAHKEIIVYPNPTKNIITIDLNDVSANEIELMDLSGRKIFVAKIDNSYEKSIDLSDFSSGIYYLNVIMNEKLVEIVKIVKN
jgi:hypothetical protein